MTEVGNPEIEALSSMKTNQSDLLDINLDKSEENSRHDSLRLSDKPQMQQVNDDDLLSQINDICGEEFPEPKSATSYDKPESLESISEESLPNSNADSLLNDDPVISNSKDHNSPISEDEEMSLLVDDDDDFLDKEIDPPQLQEESKHENESLKNDCVETEKENDSPISMEEESEVNLLNGDDSQSKDVDLDMMEDTPGKDENSADSLTKDEDSEMKDVDFKDDEYQIKDCTELDLLPNDDNSETNTVMEEESESKTAVEEDDSETKTAVEEDDSETKIAVEEDDSETRTAIEEDPSPVQEESNPSIEVPNAPVEESKTSDDESKIIVEAPKTIVEESKTEIEASTTVEVEESKTVVEATTTTVVEESQTVVDVESDKLEDESNKVDDSMTVEDLEKEDKLLEEDEVDCVQQSAEVATEDVVLEDGELAEPKRKREDEKSEEEPKESDAKRLKAIEEAEDSDDDIQFFPVTDATTPKPPQKPTENDDSDEEIIFYKVPGAEIVDEDDDDIQIIEDPPKATESKPEDPKSKEDEKPEEPSTKTTEQPEVIKDDVEVVSKEATVTEEKPVEITPEPEPEKKEASPKAVVEKDEDSDDDIMIVEDDQPPIVSLMEDDPSDNVNESEKPKETEKVVVSTEEKIQQSEKKDIQSEKPLASDEEKTKSAEQKETQPEKEVVEVDNVEIIKDDDSKSTETSASNKDPPLEKKDNVDKVTSVEKETSPDTILVDNSDNACDASEPKDGVTVEIDDAASNCSTSSNLLKCGPKSAMDREREEYGKAKRMRMSIDTEASNMSSDTDVSQSYSSHSLKRSHSQSPSNAENDDSHSKKSKLSDNPPEKLDLNPDIVKKIHKKLKKMSQKDLEHLVLQKIVESINYESKMSTLNEQLEKTNDKVQKFSQQCTNLQKQFNDLQLVHTRVTADLEKRNTSYVMPIKITRAVGLQVSIGTKASAEGRNTFVVSSTNSTTTVKTPAVPASPVQPPSQPQTPTPIQNTSVSQTQTPSPASSARRGCVQKITPKRPVPVKSTTPNSQLPPAVPPQLQQQNHQPPKVLNRSAPTTPNLPKTLIKPPISTPPTQPSLTIANLERNIQKLTASNPIVRHNTQTSVMKKTAGGGPQPPKSMTPAAVMKNLPSSISIQPYSGAAESSSEPKPQKGFIDLTDDDDAPQPAPYNGITTRQQAMRPTPQTIITRQQQQQQQQLQQQQHQPPQQQQLQQQQQNNPFVKIAPKQQPIPQHLLQQKVFKHPAALPRVPEQKSLPHWKPIPPKPIIRINNSRAGIVISWAMEQSIDRFATITNYQIYAYQAPNDIAPSTEHWRYVDVVEAMLLPMAVTLTEFQEGLKYFFSVRAVDEYKRVGPFSLPRTWDSVK